MKSEDIKELPDEQPSVESANDQQETQETTVGIAPGIESKKSYPVQTANKVLKVLDSEEQGKFLCREFFCCRLFGVNI